MTPTEHDKELRAYIAERFGMDKHEDWYDSYRYNDRVELLNYITADRKRVALEAELQLLTYLLDERTEHMFMQNPDTGEMTGNGWLCNTSLSAVSASRIEAERRKRIAELEKENA